MCVLVRKRSLFSFVCYFKYFFFLKKNKILEDKPLSSLYFVYRLFVFSDFSLSFFFEVKIDVCDFSNSIVSFL